MFPLSSVCCQLFPLEDEKSTLSSTITAASSESSDPVGLRELSAWQLHWFEVLEPWVQTLVLPLVQPNFLNLSKLQVPIRY